MGVIVYISRFSLRYLEEKVWIKLVGIYREFNIFKEILKNNNF